MKKSKGVEKYYQNVALKNLIFNVVLASMYSILSMDAMSTITNDSEMQNPNRRALKTRKGNDKGGHDSDNKRVY